MAKRKCDCWKGYERVPGTKPCSNESCRKMGEEKEAKPKQKSPAAKRLAMKRKK